MWLGKQGRKSFEKDSQQAKLSELGKYQYAMNVTSNILKMADTDNSNLVCVCFLLYLCFPADDNINYTLLRYYLNDHSR